MARQPMTPSAPAKRGKNTASPKTSAKAPAKAKVRRESDVAVLAEMPSATMPDASTSSATSSAVQQQTFEKPAVFGEPQHAVHSPDVGREDRAGRALEAVKTLGDMIAEGIGALGELRTEVQRISGRLDQLTASQSHAGRSDPKGMADAADSRQAGADDYQFGRDRDPGDAVPPGVAVMSPTPLAETDQAALHSLEELPKRAGRMAKRTPRAKA